MLLVAVTRGVLMEAMALGPVFSIQVWSMTWVATNCPRTRVILGVNRCTMDGKYPNMLEKL